MKIIIVMIFIVGVVVRPKASARIFIENRVCLHSIALATDIFQYGKIQNAQEFAHFTLMMMCMCVCVSV